MSTINLNLTDSSNHLTDLINVGADALSNLYFVTFLGDNDEDLGVTYRIESFNPPVPTHQTTPIDFMTETLERPNTSFDITKEFTLRIRLDQSYSVYKTLLDIQSKNVSESLSTAGNTVDNNLKVIIKVAHSSTDGDVTLMTNEAADLSSQNNWVTLYKYEYCWISKITPPSFDYASSDAQTVEVTVKFFKYSGPFPSN